MAIEIPFWAVFMQTFMFVLAITFAMIFRVEAVEAFPINLPKKVRRNFKMGLN